MRKAKKAIPIKITKNIERHAASNRKNYILVYDHRGFIIANKSKSQHFLCRYHTCWRNCYAGSAERLVDTYSI